MTQRAEEPQAAAAPESDDPLERLREEIAAGAPLAGTRAARFYRAVHARDPAATEETLAVLPGNRGVHLYDSLIAWAPVVAGERIIDLGCGAGGSTRAAARAVGPQGMVLGVDISPECIEAARARTPEELPILYRRADARALDQVPDRSFDCAVASLLLDELEDLEALLGEVFRVLRPGGRFVASVVDFDSWRPLDAALMGKVLAIVGQRAPGALAGRASRASIPHDARDRRAFASCGLNTVEEQDVQLVSVMADVEAAWRLFSRSHIAYLLDEEGHQQVRKLLGRRTPHTLYLPMRFLRTRRPG